jgi:hypothetical protein
LIIQTARAALDKKLDQAISNVRDRTAQISLPAILKRSKVGRIYKKTVRKSSDFNNIASTGNAVKGSFIANSDKKNFISFKEDGHSGYFSKISKFN